MEVHISSRFKRAYKKLSLSIQDDFNEKIILFIKDPFHPLLRTHKLKGKLQTCFAFRLKDGYRVLFDFSSPGVVDIFDIGHHDLYQKY
ncbi:MAG TPA: type II toxin-antitoxin system mRNA interferase toxin, RelE/StbE family [Candidatus Magasanikbacteria bacterium]|nr:MAG: hypothetical protein A3I74_02625 [Candidatus Magasanikbacteria bacterium RIFCSPLOWO2_02_FULL_47_16]OGH79718.1 MAG: hypothetical protein A3C10_00775 [Candidatus Magasanikbacteria bacterium RIFCSPHIGHO2_02_FULL_48_18]OGH82044.1 MAG: hypothetical protein A3G08_02285 [Candidatus Magasanikbacteria bacterium RIFCSPLOWO2_12_FULL_47_9b]HAZ28240.1 type II toxin-antitoxin system mRNA interferase toxin, RelE/StbE family [Candidatus Magasanikbacteria bacterium]